jgi:hypothetical protein
MPATEVAAGPAARRRQLIGLLNLAESAACYARRKICDGAGPAESRSAALATAGVLAATARELRHTALGDQAANFGDLADEVSGREPRA